ncbi:BRO family protein [Jeotgalibaca porci]|uniref:BRO family protein n=1 Tax=Jeotgalibaca porci TaxID=1868793 RepID=UPI0035A0A060
MANLQIFAFEGTDEIRTLLINDEPYFVANDIARSLGYKNPSDATNKYCKRSIKTWGSDSLGRQQEFKVIPESDVYRLIIKSNLPRAERFEEWVMEEVLPSVRKHGNYSLPTDPMEVLKLMFQATEEIQADVQGVKGRVIELEENQSINPGDYGYISRRIHQRVAEVARGYGKITQKQRGELYRDINGGIKKITGVGSRTQLRDKHYQTVVDFINDWEPSTATKTIVRQSNFFEDEASSF